jgi:SEC-C motif-containing protein
MRSRYSAFVLRNEAYLLATWHPTTRPAGIPFDPGQEWLLLRVIATSTTGDTATVEFSARSRTSGRTELLHENSRFVREGGHWLYLSGTVR